MGAEYYHLKCPLCGDTWTVIKDDRALELEGACLKEGKEVDFILLFSRLGKPPGPLDHLDPHTRSRVLERRRRDRNRKRKEAAERVEGNQEAVL